MRRANFVGTKFGGGGEARAGREFIFPTPLFLPAPPERKLSKVSVRIFFKKSSDFVQDRHGIRMIDYPLQMFLESSGAENIEFIPKFETGQYMQAEDVIQMQMAQEKKNWLF